MFFTKAEMEVAEDLAWKMLDGWNHSYYPNLKDYAHFYFNGNVILDPWMNEKSQGLPWPDHESKESKVNPIEYYGQNTIEDFVVNLFMFRPEWEPEIIEKIRINLNDTGRLKRTTTIMPVEVFIAMSEEQAIEENSYSCIESELPDSKRVYFDMVNLPSENVTVIKNGWEKEVIFLKKDAKKVFSLLYPSGTDFDYKKAIKRINGRVVRLLGFGD